ncbi:MAG TPA: DUF6049 family protein [Frankiaceae bacterium]
MSRAGPDPRPAAGHAAPRAAAPTAAPRGRRRAVALVAALALLVLCTGLPGTGTARAAASPQPRSPGVTRTPAPSPTGTPSPAATANNGGRAGGPVLVSVDTLTPAAPVVGDTLVVRGTLRLPAGATATVTALSVQLRLGTPVPSRSALHRLQQQPLTNGAGFGARVPVPGSLAAGGTLPFVLSAPLTGATQPAAANVIYPLVVVATGRVAGGHDGRDGTRDAGSQQTFLPWFPVPGVQATRIAVVWPVTAPAPAPVPGASGRAATSGAAAAEPDPDTTVSAASASAMAAGGRWSDIVGPLVAARGAGNPTGVPVTAVTSPELLGQLSLAAAQHTETAADGTATTRPADPAAAHLLAVLRSVATVNPPVTQSYADVDLSGLAQARLGDDLTTATTLGRTITGTALGQPADTALAWPPQGQVTPGGLAGLAADGTAGVLLAESAVTGRDARSTLTPSATVRLSADGRPVTGLVADPDLSTVLASGGRDGSGPRLAAQTFLTELAMVTAEAPNLRAPRTLVAVPPGTWDPDPAWAGELLAVLGQVPWAAPVSLHAALDAADTAGSPATLAERDGSPTDLPPTLAAVRRLHDALRDFAVVLPPTETVTAPARRARLRAESADWRAAPDGGAAEAAALAAAQRALAALTSGVRIAASTSILLTSRTGRFAVTVVNDLPETVTVVPRVRSLAGSRLLATLELSGPIVLPRGTRIQVTVRTTQPTQGTFPVELTLQTPSGGSVGTPVRIEVHSSAYGVIGLGITYVASGLLVAALLVRGVRAALRRRRAAEAS